MSREHPTTDHCDKCGKWGYIERLPTGGDGGVFLCHACWDLEMGWRRQENKRGVVSPYIILPWLGPRVTP